MGESVYENSHAERVNGIIKNDYDPQDFDSLVKLLDKAVKNYNYERPHQSLGNYTPQQVEQGDYRYRQKIKMITSQKHQTNPNRIVNQLSKTVNSI